MWLVRHIPLGVCAHEANTRTSSVAQFADITRTELVMSISGLPNSPSASSVEADDGGVSVRGGQAVDVGASVGELGEEGEMAEVAEEVDDVDGEGQVEPRASYREFCGHLVTSWPPDRMDAPWEPPACPFCAEAHIAAVDIPQVSP